MANAWDGVLAAGAVNDEWAAFYAQQAMRMSTTDGSAPRFDTVAAAPAPAAPAPVAAAAPAAAPAPAPAGQPATLSQGTQQYFAPQTGGSGWSPSDSIAYTDPASGKTYTKVGGGETGQPLQIIEFDPRTQKPGDTLNVFNADGTFSHQFQSSQDEGTKLAMMALAAAGGMMMLPGGMFSGSFGAGNMAAQAGLEAGGAAAGGVGATLGQNGAFLGEGMASGVPAWDAAATNAGLSLTVPPVLPPGSTPPVVPPGTPPGTVPPIVPPGSTPPVVPPVVPPGSGSVLDTIGRVAQVAAPIVGGVVASNAARDAADTQAAAGREANALMRELYYDQVNRAEPFRIAGVQSINTLADRLGVSGRTGAQGYGDLTKKFTMADFQQDPGYAFRMQQGQQALDRRLAAGGNLYSGKAIKDTLAYGQGMGAQEYGAAYGRWNDQNTNTYNRLAGVAGAGQTANSQIGSAAQNYGNTSAGITTSIGNARAAGQVGSANALMNGITQGISSYMNNNILERVLGGRGY